MDAPSALTRTTAYDPAAVPAHRRDRGDYRFAGAAAVAPPAARPIDPIEPYSPDYGSVDAETARKKRGAEPWALPADTGEVIDGDTDVGVDYDVDRGDAYVVPGYEPTSAR